MILFGLLVLAALAVEGAWRWWTRLNHDLAVACRWVGRA